ncbi:MAG: MBL fold metallo-hydrolase [Clostridia bacterium]|nr:MBL fold metallo-hydrolase [Clostridia bacterium]
MIFERLPNGMLDSNCYIVGEQGEVAVIDAGVEHKAVLEFLRSKDLKVKYIILTHGHADHIYYVDHLRKDTGAPVLIHEGDAEYLEDARLNGSWILWQEITFKHADELLKDKQVLEVGGLQLEIIHTPGHTPGSICILAQNNLITGDTLFKMSMGRTDLTGGNAQDMHLSLKKLMKLPDEILVYPGHGGHTTIGFERERNPFIRNL